ncbi:MAG: ORF6N domain-containing protein [Thiovulaceae bacterium]|nr:ORF6N domain-containing protein [Sulfurimonadaceae bacterium]
MDKALVITEESIRSKIYFIRRLQVMLDEDLAKLYEVETRRLNEAVKNRIYNYLRIKG